MKAARLVVLGIALVVGGAAAYLVSGDEPPKVALPTPVPQLATVDVLIAKNDINMGSAVGAQDFQWQQWPAATTGGSYILKKERPSAVEELAGSIARGPFTAGEPIREAKLIKANGSGYMAAILPSGMRAISTEISPETGAGGFILPNDRVDVILSRRERSGDARNTETTTSETILTNVRVLAIDQGFPYPHIYIHQTLAVTLRHLHPTAATATAYVDHNAADHRRRSEFPVLER